MPPQESSKKRKRESSHKKTESIGIDTSKPTAIYRPARGRTYTVSVAIPGSVIANAQTHDLKTSLCGSIARALSVFCVDEVVIFDDGCNSLYQKPLDPQHAARDAHSGYSAFADPNNFLYHVLSYLETPPTLRRTLFSHHPNLRTAGSLPSLDIPSHLREAEWCQYREGVTVDPPTPAGKVNSEHVQKKMARDTYVQAGLREPILISPPPPDQIPPNTRVTLRFPTSSPPKRLQSITAEIVDPATPREEAGYYWGYSTRVAASLADVFTECLFDEGYDYSIGMSERGIPLRELLAGLGEPESTFSTERSSTAGPPPTWKHLLLVFGGPPGLEKAVANDAILAEKGVTNAAEVFDAWINLVQGQGSRTIRTEEALWLGLMGCWELVRAREEREARLEADNF